MSLLPVAALSALLHSYIGLRLLPALAPGWAAAVLVLLAASAVVVPLGLVAGRRLRTPAADRFTWVGMLFLGLFSSLLVATLVRDAVLLAAWALDFALDVPLAAIARTSAVAVPLVALAATALGLWNARRTAQVVRVEVPLAGLAPGLQGFRIVQISDIHVGPTIKHDYLRAVVERVNALQPDLVAITGDLVDGSVAQLREHVAPLAGLRSRHGTYFVTGNHEYYSGVHGWMEELRALGIRVLHNEHVLLAHGGAQLVLAGVTDYTAHHFDPAHRSNPRAALAGAPAGAPKVLLAHQPRSAAAAAEAGFDLQLSGHTHGGQFLPWNFLVPLQQPYTAGLHQLGRLWIYVSRGTGYWGPPKRLGAPSEISEIRLGSA
jgi:predicted MPP superfamily phosphohydrolase